MGPVRQNPIQRTVSLFICVCIALCTIVAHNIAQNRPDSFPPYPPDDHHPLWQSYRQRCTQVSNVKSQASLKSLGASRMSSLKSFRSSLKSSLKSLPNLSFLPCLGRSFTNYVTQICVIWTHPTLRSGERR